MGCANSQPQSHTKSGNKPVINQLSDNNLQNRNQKLLTSSNNNGLGYKNQSKTGGQQSKKPTQLGYNNSGKVSEKPASKIQESNISKKESNNNGSGMMGNTQKIASELISQKKAPLLEQQVKRDPQSLNLKKSQQAAKQASKQRPNHTTSVQQSLKTPQLQDSKRLGYTKELQKTSQIKHKKQQAYQHIEPNLKQQNLQNAKQLAENLKREEQTKIYQKTIIPLSEIKQVPQKKQQQSIKASNSANKNQSPQKDSLKLPLMGLQYLHSIKPIHDKPNEIKYQQNKLNQSKVQQNIKQTLKQSHKKVENSIRQEDIKPIVEENNYKDVSGLHQISTEDLTVSKQQIFDLECNFNPQSLIIDINKVGW